jgi:hypothetical protein
MQSPDGARTCVMATRLLHYEPEQTTALAATHKYQICGRMLAFPMNHYHLPATLRRWMPKQAPRSLLKLVAHA